MPSAPFRGRLAIVSFRGLRQMRMDHLQNLIRCTGSPRHIPGTATLAEYWTRSGFANRTGMAKWARLNDEKGRSYAALNRYRLIPSFLIFDSSVCLGTPSLA